MTRFLKRAAGTLAKLSLPAVVVALLAAPVAAHAQPQPPANPTPVVAGAKAKVVGRWHNAAEKDWLTFAEDGTVRWTMYNNFGTQITYGGGWTLDGDTLRVTFASNAGFTTRVTFRGNTEMTLTEGRDSRRYVRE